MAASITIGSLVLASDGKTLTGTLSGGTGTGYTPATGVRNFSITVNGNARNLCSSAISGTTWTGVAYTPIVPGATVAVEAESGTGTSAGMTYLSDSGGNTATAQSYAVTNNSTKTSADAIAAACSIPSGALSGWTAARAMHASQRVETVVFGDSTSADSGADYSWAYEVRKLAIAAGFTDGGRGLVEPFDTADRSGPADNLNCIQSQTGWDSGANVFPGMFPCFVSETAGDSVVLQGNGTTARIFFTRLSTVGDFTYSKDGGTAVTVNANGQGVVETGIVEVDLGADGLHTVTLVNLGSRVQAAPAIGGSQDSPATGTLAAGTYYYVVTGVVGAGETTASSVLTTVNTGGNRRNGITITNNGATSYNLYRSLSSSGPFAFLKNVATGGGSFTAAGDGSFEDGSETLDTGHNPPTIGTALNTASNKAGVVVDFMKPTGLVWHKNAASGATFGTYGLDEAYNNFPYQAALGLTQVDGSTTSAARPPNRDPALAVCALGINNQQGGTPYSVAYSNAVTKFITAAKAAADSVLIVIPHFSRSASFVNAKEYIDATKTACATADVAWLDFNVVLDLAGYGLSGPHLNQTGYNIEARYAWDAVLGPAAFTVAGPSSGAVNVPSSAFTVTRNSGLTFNGTDTITLTPANGTITATAAGGSVSGNGTGVVVITPAAGMASFTYTLTSASAGSNPTVLSNGQGWTDAEPVEFLATAAANIRAARHHYSQLMGAM